MSSGLPWGLALSSGVNTYLPLFLLALFARFGHVVHVSRRFEWLTSDQALILLGVLAACEVLAQKFPVLDNAWDFVHTLLRPMAGALAAGATMTTNNAFETSLAMLMGGSLAAAAHSTKSSLRLMSTTKSFGLANFVLSLGEDAAVLAAALLSFYAPWVMLGIVLLFLLVFALIGPRLVRTLWFDLCILGAWLVWLGRQAFRLPTPASLEESLLELSPRLLASLRGHLDPGEDLYGALMGWSRSWMGPRRAWVLLTSQHLLWIGPRLLRRPRVRAIPYSNFSLARYRNLVLFSRVDVLTRQNERLALSLSKKDAPIGEMAVRRIIELANLPSEPAYQGSQVNPKLASAPR
jgi:hypothetical protein